MWLVSLPLTRLEHWTSSKVCFWSEGRVCGKCCTKLWVWKAGEVEWWGLGKLQSGCGWMCSGRMKWGWAAKITLNHLLSAANLFWFSWENVVELEKGLLAAGFSSKECGGLGLVTPGSQKWKWNWRGWLVPATGSGGTMLSKALPWCTDTLAIRAIVSGAVPLEFHPAWWFYFSLDYWEERMQRIYEAAKLPFVFSSKETISKYSWGKEISKFPIKIPAQHLILVR